MLIKFPVINIAKIQVIGPAGKEQAYFPIQELFPEDHMAFVEDILFILLVSASGLMQGAENLGVQLIQPGKSFSSGKVVFKVD